MSGPFIVAEMSANHLGSLDRALAIVDAAADAGADAVKVQTWAQERMVVDRAYVVRDGPWAGHNLYELYNQARTPWEWHKTIFERCRARGIVGFASVFDTLALEFLELLHCPVYKISSFEITDLPLIAAVAARGKPIIISTGMANHLEISEAFAVASRGGATDITLLYCSSAYPAPVEELDLGYIRCMQDDYPGTAIGFSDHTLGCEAAIAATALGAEMIEKHLTLARTDGGPDAGFSAQPAELKELTQACRRIGGAMRNRQVDAPRDLSCGEYAHRQLRRSLYYSAGLEAGQLTGGHNVVSARPAGGVSPRYRANVLGQKLARAVRAGDPVCFDDFERGETLR